jgi:ADP-heptose:LPS heptosyltransferase
LKDIARKKEWALKRRIRKRHLEAVIYYLMKWVATPFLHRKQPSRQQAPKKILIIHAKQHIGDIVVSMPFSRVLKQAYPTATIAVLVPSDLVKVVKCDKSVDFVAAYPRRWEIMPWYIFRLRKKLQRLSCDTVFVLSIHFFSILLAFLCGARNQFGYNYNGRGFLLNDAITPHFSCNRSGWEYELKDRVPHITEFWDRLLKPFNLSGLPPSWSGLSLALQTHDVNKWMMEMLSGLPRPYIGMNTGARNPIRNWDPKKFVSLCGQIQTEIGGTIIFTGADDDRHRIIKIQEALHFSTASAAGHLDIAQSWELIRHLNFVISVDTAVIHLCAALRVPVISLFGPGDPLIWGPYGFADLVIQKHEACQRCKGGRCVQNRVYCMEEITIQDVMEIIRKNAYRLINLSGNADRFATVSSEKPAAL